MTHRHTDTLTRRRTDALTHRYNRKHAHSHTLSNALTPFLHHHPPQSLAGEWNRHTHTLSLTHIPLIFSRPWATHCNTLQHIATYCNTLQPTATHLIITHSLTHTHLIFCILLSKGGNDTLANNLPPAYGVATISRLLKSIGLICRISYLL